MDWETLLAYISGSVDEELLLRNEYLVAENHILRDRSPWLNAFAERWIQSVKTEVLSRMILFGERSLRHVLSEYVAHHHAERPHQDKGNVILFPSAQVEPDSESPIECRERLGGLLTYYHRKAA